MEILLAIGVVAFVLIAIGYVFTILLFLGWCLTALQDDRPNRRQRGKVTRN